MIVLVTGGTGVIGNGVIPQLLQSGHKVRLLSRHASDDARRWKGVEAHDGDVADPGSLSGAATECDAIVHIAGISAENPPDVTFERINVDGTRHLLAEAARGGVRRFVFISSLGAERGASEYHKSKLAAEQLVSSSSLDWTIVRAGNVYGPGDEVISTMLKLVRSLPAVPMIDRGDQPFQPIWFEDLGRAIGSLIDRGEASREIVAVAGEEKTTMDDLFSRLSDITGRRPIRIPVPMPLASLAARLLEGIIPLPVDDNKLTMLEEENVVDAEANALRRLIQNDPVTLDAGLKLLADALREQLPEDGIGAMDHKRFWADIAGSRYPAASLMTEFRNNLNDVMPLEFAAEPGSSTQVEKGETLTGALPLRGNFQVRVEEADPTHVVFATVDGHPLAGIVEFTTSDVPEGVRFAIDIRARAANRFDLVAVKTLGAPMQSANWRAVVQKIIDISGGTSEGVRTESKRLDDDEAGSVEKRVRSMVQKRQREESDAPAKDTSQR